MNRIIKYIKKILGITELENKLSSLQKKHDRLVDIVEKHERLLVLLLDDNQLMISQMKLINKDFSVVADINHSKYEPSVVIVMKNIKTKKML